MTQPTDLIEQLATLAEKATPGPWEVQDGNSWRRLGTPEQDGAVLYPTTYSTSDNHPDLSAARGNDLYSNLALIVLLRNNVDAIIALGRERDAFKSAFGEAWETLSWIAVASECDASSAAAREALGRASQALEGDNQ